MTGKNDFNFRSISSIVKVEKAGDGNVEKLALYHGKVKKIIENINRVMVGQEEVSVLSLAALFAEGHVLLEDVPGVGKTMLVRTLAKSLDCDFRRIQFTPDLLPSDVTGVSIYNPKTFEFEFRGGPILGNIVLADEINRTSPKTQSALLEGMEEKSVTVDGRSIPLKRPFFVMATQNPIEYEGTYPLPEAQLDRFIIKLKMGYPTMKDELDLLDRTSKQHPIDTIQPVISQQELLALQAEVQDVYVEPLIYQYIINLVKATREHGDIFLGVSPRGSIALMKIAKAYAYILGREYVLPDDVKLLSPLVLGHRIILNAEAQYEGKTNDHVIRSIIEQAYVPIRKEFDS